MTKTQAERSAAYRQRRDDRLRRYEAALWEIAGGWWEGDEVAMEMARKALEEEA